MQSVKVPPRSMAISMPALSDVGGGVKAEGILRRYFTEQTGLTAKPKKEKVNENVEVLYEIYKTVQLTCEIDGMDKERGGSPSPNFVQRHTLKMRLVRRW